MLDAVDFTATATGAIIVSVEILPDSTQLDAIGATASLTARALGTQGQQVAGAQISWRSLDPSERTFD